MPLMRVVGVCGWVGRERSSAARAAFLPRISWVRPQSSAGKCSPCRASQFTVCGWWVCCSGVAGAVRRAAVSGCFTRAVARDACRLSPDLSDGHGSDLRVLPPVHDLFLAQAGMKFAVCVYGVCRRCSVVLALRGGLLDHDTACTDRSQRSLLPCWWSRVVRGWASCCGHDVLPLSLDDPGGVVTRSSRALVTADKGNDPLCVRSFVTWVRDRSSTG